MRTSEKPKLFCQITGEGKPVVLLHGNGESHAIFDRMSEQLVQAGYRVIAPDSPGQGTNPPLPEYHYEEMAEAVYEFIQDLHLEKPALYGFSDGGILGLLIEIRHPGTLSILAVSGANLSPAGLDPAFVSEFEGNEEPLVKLMFTEPDLSPEELETIGIPVLVTAGSNDLILPEETEMIASHLTDSRLVIIEGADHGSYIENSDAMGKLLVSFLQEQQY